jgi:hypothetical protein
MNSFEKKRRREEDKKTRRQEEKKKRNNFKETNALFEKEQEKHLRNKNM